MQTKGQSNGGLHWDAKAITRSAFRMMKTSAIIAALLENVAVAFVVEQIWLKSRV